MPVSRLASLLLLQVLLGSVVCRPASASEDVYHQVLQAARARDGERLVRLAQRDDLDPWLVMDMLLREGERDGAKQFVEAATSPDAEAVLRYLATPPTVDPGLVSDLDRAVRLLTDGEPDRAAAILARRSRAVASVVAVRAQRALGLAEEELGHPEKAVSSYEEMRSIAAELGWLRGQRDALHFKFRILMAECRYPEAARCLAPLRVVAVELEEPAEVVLVRRYECELDLCVGAPRAAVVGLREATAFFDAQGLVSDAAHARVDLALALGDLGEYAEALSSVERAARDAARVKDVDTLEYARLTQLFLEIDLGRYHDAIEDGETLLAAGLSDPVDEALLRANLGLALAKTGRHEAAAESLERARQGFAALGRGEFVGWLHMYRALSLHASRGDWKHVLDDAAQAIERLEAGTKDAAWAHFTQAIGHIGREEWTQASLHLDSAKAASDRHGIYDLGAAVRGRQAEVALGRGQVTRAVELCAEAVAYLDASTIGLADEEDISARSDEERARIFRTWASAARATGDVGMEFQAIEAGRARLLVRAMGGAHLARGLDISPELRNAEREAQRRLVSARQRHIILLRRHRSNTHPVVKRARKERDLAERRLSTVIDQVQRQAGARAALAYPRPAEIGAFRESMAADEAVILYDVGDDEGRALLVCRACTRSVPVRDWRGVLAACAGVRRPDPDVGHAEFRSSCDLLEQRLIADLGVPPSVRRLFVSPAGPLVAVPWGALPVIQLGRYEIGVIPSARALQLSRAAPHTEGTRSLAFGDPLYEKQLGGRRVPWSRHGVHLPRLPASGGESRPLINASGGFHLVRAAASETAFKARMADGTKWDVVHLGCHGVVDDMTPGLTCVALSPSDEDDGFLTAGEVFLLTIHARLVVLSACDVGRSQHRGGVGLLGFVRAVMAAGSPQVVTSLWPADDEATAYLMQKFYAARLAGEGARSALRTAQESVCRYVDDRGRRTWEAPYYWAGWIVWGDGPR